MDQESLYMTQIFRYFVALTGLSLAALTAATAQVPYSQGNVERVVLIHILPGHSDAFMADLKKNVVPIWEAEKTAGIIVSYQIFLNSTTSGPDDWDLGYTLVFKNMAALDGLPDKAYDLRMKQYGDRDAEQKVIDKRVENAHVVSSMLIRDVTLR
jgi:hypothetical protein